MQEEEDTISRVGPDLRSALSNVIEDMRQLDLRVSIVYVLRSFWHFAPEKSQRIDLPGTAKENISQLLGSLEIELRKELCYG